jgi:glycine/D-amino acid oxidase-like deaminating enzyme
MPRGFGLEIDPDYFDREMRPALAERTDAFRSARMLRAYSGLFDQNELDTNAIIGPWSGGLDNFYMMAGFSGHGFMHVPGAGRAIAELILDGGFQTIDLANFGWRRVEENKPYRERRID